MFRCMHVRARKRTAATLMMMQKLLAFLLFRRSPTVFADAGHEGVLGDPQPNSAAEIEQQAKLAWLRGSTVPQQQAGSRTRGG